MRDFRPERPRYIVAADLGQTQDPTAIAVAEITGTTREERRFDFRHLERHLGKPYAFVAQRVKALVERLPERDTIVGYDMTGVGRAVAELFKAAEIAAPLYGVTITGGDTVSRERNDFHVPKRDLVGELQVVLEGGRVRIAKRLPLAEMLVRELLNFRVKTTSSANETFEPWRSGQHDDFVLAAAIAVWLGRKLNPGAPFFFVSAEQMGASPAQIRDARWGGSGEGYSDGKYYTNSRQYESEMDEYDARRKADKFRGF